MKGAIAELLVSTMSTPTSNKTMMIGRSQNFFLIFKKFQRSDKNSIRFLLR